VRGIGGAGKIAPGGRGRRLRPGLAAKPVIDVQVSVAAFEPIEPFKAPLERMGYVFRRADEWAQLLGWSPGPSDS
jgi:hypothetical protein